MLPRLTMREGTSSNADIMVAADPPENPPRKVKADVQFPTLASGPNRALMVCTDIYAEASLGSESKQAPVTIQAPFFHARKSYLFIRRLSILRIAFM